MQNNGIVVDWQALEQALFDSIKAQVEAFSKTHQDDVFYGFAIDCNAYYANVLFCLNTLESLDETAKEYADHDDEASVTQEKSELEWSLGDWQYVGFNLDSPSWEDEVPFLEQYSELPDDQQTEEFLNTCCRALVHAEQDGAFSVLNCTDNFRVACMDHDEDIETGDRRLERIRASS